MSLERLAAQMACRDLMSRYCGFVDARRHDELAGLFAPDGVLHIAGRELQGPTAIRSFFDQRPPTLSVHLPGGEWVDPDLGAGRAVGGCAAAVYRLAADPSTLTLPQRLSEPQVVARYEDRFVLTPDGWRFASRAALPIFIPN